MQTDNQGLCYSFLAGVLFFCSKNSILYLLWLHLNLIIGILERNFGVEVYQYDKSRVWIISVGFLIHYVFCWIMFCGAATAKKV
jgi:hypothetical protein